MILVSNQLWFVRDYRLVGCMLICKCEQWLKARVHVVIEWCNERTDCPWMIMIILVWIIVVAEVRHNVLYTILGHKLTVLRLVPKFTSFMFSCCHSFRNLFWGLCKKICERIFWMEVLGEPKIKELLQLWYVMHCGLTAFFHACIGCWDDIIFKKYPWHKIIEKVDCFLGWVSIFQARVCSDPLSSLLICWVKAIFTISWWPIIGWSRGKGCHIIDHVNFTAIISWEFSSIVPTSMGPQSSSSSSSFQLEDPKMLGVNHRCKRTSWEDQPFQFLPMMGKHRRIYLCGLGIVIFDIFCCSQSQGQLWWTSCVVVNNCLGRGLSKTRWIKQSSISWQQWYLGQVSWPMEAAPWLGWCKKLQKIQTNVHSDSIKIALSVHKKLQKFLMTCRVE